MTKPYGANDKTDKWAKAHGLRYSPHGRCLHWLATGRCSDGLCLKGHSSQRWMDHISGWIDRGGKRLLLCQPYELSDPQSLADACREFNLNARVTGEGWYGHGTIAIELRKARGASSDVTVHQHTKLRSSAFAN